MIITDILAAVLVYKLAYMLFPAPEPIYYKYEGVLRVLLNFDLLMFLLLLSLAVGGDSTRYALGYAYLFVRRVALLAWEWAILPCLKKIAFRLARVSGAHRLWPRKGHFQPVARVLLPAAEMMRYSSPSVLSPPASCCPAEASPPPAVALPAGAPASACPVVVARPFLPPAIGSFAVVLSDEARALASDPGVPVLPAVLSVCFVGGNPSFPVLPSAPVAPASPVVPALRSVPFVRVPRIRRMPSAPSVPALPSVRSVSAEPFVPALPPVYGVLAGTGAPPMPVPFVGSPAAPRASFAGRAERLLVSRGSRVRLGACGGVCAGVSRAVVKAVHTHIKVGKIKPPCALRRVARAALAAGAVKSAPFRFPVAPASSSGDDMEWMASEACTVKVARMPARRVVSARRFLRPPVLPVCRPPFAGVFGVPAVSPPVGRPGVGFPGACAVPAQATTASPSPGGLVAAGTLSRWPAGHSGGLAVPGPAPYFSAPSGHSAANLASHVPSPLSSSSNVLDLLSVANAGKHMKSTCFNASTVSEGRRISPRRTVANGTPASVRLCCLRLLSPPNPSHSQDPPPSHTRCLDPGLNRIKNFKTFYAIVSPDISLFDHSSSRWRLSWSLSIPHVARAMDTLFLSVPVLHRIARFLAGPDAEIQ
ncbi:hypothetical protein [Parasitella parasitica]|uniref:Uncharacterized protein n=1 Tax=Parasitella parasitica TaxID=35722 RepID=A0A0B7NAF2_9FUNG|nr:hypothetical protein [Parasitella parasitica]